MFIPIALLIGHSYIFYIFQYHTDYDLTRLLLFKIVSKSNEVVLNLFQPALFSRSRNGCHPLPSNNAA